MINSQVYKEVLTVIYAFNLEDAIPKNLIFQMEKKQDKNYNFVFDANIPIEEQKISQKAAAMLSVLYIKYICTDDNEKVALKNIYEGNESPDRNETITYGATNNLESLNETLENIEEESNKLMLTNQSIFQKIIQLIRKFFKR